MHFYTSIKSPEFSFDIAVILSRLDMPDDNNEIFDLGINFYFM